MSRAPVFPAVKKPPDNISSKLFFSLLIFSMILKTYIFKKVTLRDSIEPSHRYLQTSYYLQRPEVKSQY